MTRLRAEGIHERTRVQPERADPSCEPETPVKLREPVAVRAREQLAATLRGELRGWAIAGTLALFTTAAAVEAPSAYGSQATPRHSSQQRTTASKRKPVRAVAPPTNVSLALARTTQARYVILTESSQTATTKYVVDNRDGKAQAWTGRSVSLIQLGRMVYAPQAKGCYVSTRRPSGLLPNVAGMLLPSGVAAMHYTAQGRTIHWSIKTSGKYQPHGTVTVNKAGVIISATVYSGPGVPMRAVVSYPVRAPKISAPRELCRK